MILHSENKKSDLRGRWNRPDRALFASGACHILADAFLRRFPEAGFCAVLIQPRNGARGRHVFVSDGATVFDYHGFSARDRFLQFYIGRYQRRFAGWDAELLTLTESPAGPEFCLRHGHREPSQFWQDPTPRAEAFLNRLLAKANSGFSHLGTHLRNQ